jgi:hypothetical protein
VEDLKAKAEETLEFVLHEFATVRLPSLKEECTVGAMLADYDLPASAGSDISWFTVFPAKTRQ